MNINEKINSNPEIKEFFTKFDGFRFDFLEESIKITNTNILDGRFLLGENKNQNSKQNLIKILSNLSSNKNLINESIIQLAVCDRYGFAMEIGDTVNYRIYFETEMTPYRKKIVSDDERDRTQTIIAYRWNKDDDKSVNTTYYNHLIDTSKENIKAELKSLDIQYLPEYFDNHKTFRFYTVNESKSKRNSITFQLDKFSISAVSESITKLNQNATPFIESYKNKFCGNLSYGFDKNQNLFHTFYFTLYNNVYTQKRPAR